MRRLTPPRAGLMAPPLLLGAAFLLLGTAARLGEAKRQYSLGAFYYGPWHRDPTNEKLHGARCHCSALGSLIARMAAHARQQSWLHAVQRTARPCRAAPLAATSPSRRRHLTSPPHLTRLHTYVGKNWTEWNLVEHAKPRFPGHQQPNVPLWGYEMDNDPAVMAKKIDAAADHGIDHFLFDWYWYNETSTNGQPGLFQDSALEDGFLAAANRDRIKFALMWASQVRVGATPARRGLSTG